MASAETHYTTLIVSAATLEMVCACSKESEFDCYLALRNFKADKTDHNQNRVLELLCLVMPLYLQTGDAKHPYHFQKIDNKLHPFTETDFADLRALTTAGFPDLVQARICDILWVLKKHFPSAKKAVECYLRLAEKTYDPEKWRSSIEYTRRANIIAMQLGKDSDSMKSVVAYVSAKICALDGNDPYSMSLHFIAIQHENGFGDNPECLRIAECLFTTALKDCRNQYVIIQAHDIVLALLKSLKKPDETIKTHKLRLAQYYIRFAESEVNKDRPAIGVVHWYQQAIPILRECKDEATLIDVRKKMEALQAKIPEQMQSFQHSMDISDFVKQIEDSLAGKSLSECFHFLITSIPLHKKTEVQAQVINPQNRGFTDIFPKVVVDRDGKTVFSLPSLDLKNPLEDREALEVNMHYHTMTNNQFHGDLLWRIVAYIRSQHALTVTDLDFVFENNFIVPEGRESIIKQGLFLGLTGEFYTALHLLAPQIENIFRHIAHECGDIVTTYEDKDGSEQAKVLSSIFDLPNLVDCYDEDILFAFKGLLNEKAGGNLRNLIGHGIMEPDEAKQGLVVYFICLCLRVLALSSDGYWRIVRELEHKTDEVTRAKTSRMPGMLHK